MGPNYDNYYKEFNGASRPNQGTGNRRTDNYENTYVKSFFVIGVIVSLGFKIVTSIADLKNASRQIRRQ